MRFQQIIAAVTRSLTITGVREITRVDAFAHASGLQLCMACASPGEPMYSGPASWLSHHQLDNGNPVHSLSRAWLVTAAKPALSKRKRLPLAARLLGLAERGIADLPSRDR